MLEYKKHYSFCKAKDLKLNKTIKFGTDGIRGNSNNFPFTPNPTVKLGTVIGKWSQKKYGPNITILIGHDTRESCKKIESNLIIGLKRFNITIVKTNVIPTPAIYKLCTQNPEYKLGIIISASHNPYYDNGIKLIDGKTGKLTRSDEIEIESLFNKHKDNVEDYNTNNKSQIKTSKNATQQYIQAITSKFKPNLLVGQKIVLDCANGSTYKVAPQIFKSLGAEIITINNNSRNDC